MAFHHYFYSQDANCKSKDFTHVIFRDIAGANNFDRKSKYFSS